MIPAAGEMWMRDRRLGLAERVLQAVQIAMPEELSQVSSIY